MASERPRALAVRVRDGLGPTIGVVPDRDQKTHGADGQATAVRAAQARVLATGQVPTTGGAVRAAQARVLATGQVPTTDGQVTRGRAAPATEGTATEVMETEVMAMTAGAARIRGATALATPR
jgi:hypothetical protein